MMTRFFSVLVLLLGWLGQFPAARAQSSLSGVVQDSVTHQPLAFASVFLANTTLGVTTTEQGRFEFPRVPAGSYDVVASYVGYQLGKQAITVAATPQQLTLRLSPTASQLGEVVVRAKRRPRNPGDYQRFAELFLGRSTFSQQCRIRNPNDVLVAYDPEARELTASAETYVQVDNQALGYRIKYYGLRFSSNFAQQVVSFYGQPVFEEMTPRNEQQHQRWVTNREHAYRGSLTHFLQSVRDNRVTADGFVAQRLRVVPNPRFARADSLRQDLLRARSLAGFTPAEQDSLARWAKEPRGYSMLYTVPRPIDSLRRTSADGGQTFLRFRDYLQVSYLREAPDPRYHAKTLAPPPPTAVANSAGYQISQLIMLLPEIEIQPNGQLANPLAVFTDEYWGFEKMGEFLPVNYVPPAPVRASQPTQ